MIGQEQIYTLANDASLTLPALSEGQLTIAMKDGWIGYIRHTVHNPNRMGWPDPAEEYPTLGIMLQALSVTAQPASCLLLTMSLQWATLLST
jgi:hypothetical protein